jgi:hypothetical protein
MRKENRRNWQPTPEEVERILAEMRPIIADLVKRQFQTAPTR